MDESAQQDCLEDNSMRKAANGTCSLRYSMQGASHTCSLNASNNTVDHMIGTSDAAERTTLQSDGNKSAANFSNTKLLSSEDASTRQSDSEKNPSSGSGSGGSSRKGDNDPHVVVDSVIHWEDLQLKEEIGQGKA